ncbi:heparinase II/III family protein [Bacillus sp. FJAT-26390]|uniref:heparinase II/III domain-containing protein n=1 Tax=Bacillus sp. FJAT-26390 TaxID=1743142 RepID=UPI000807E602|nr:heparinase II/III family protein [Bacillus sp. FJAT-26390]OBZ13422.1 hypothetical protein A7975_11275 [Bacillus sp. FJAT-26390]
MNDQRLNRLRTNASLPHFADAMMLLRHEVEEASQITYGIGPEEHGEWTHQYHCHHDGAQLAFDWRKPLSHLCPVCGTVWTGEPYDSAWTSLVHVTIGKAVYNMALLHMIEPDPKHLGQIKTFLTAYADYYEGYLVHGGIPYNGPGKLFAQTLDEAHWIMDLTLGFYWIREHLSLEETAHIRGGLLAPCARFLIEHKEKQIHNHSVLITSAIASIGILLNDEAIIRSGLEGEYGLYDQIRRGRFEDGLWYEGNVHYHFYAFQSLLHFALMAEGTPWEVWQTAGLKSMFDYPIHLILPNGDMPSLNDAGNRAGIHMYAPFYEIALDIFGDELYRSLLNTAYGTEWAEEPFSGAKAVARSSANALLFGRELAPIEGASSHPLWNAAHRNISLPASGITKLVNRKGWQAVIKHSKFGGEHDHMDRLGLSVVCGDMPLLVDAGTTAYGVPAHYGWFKHTFSHNTVCLNGADQPPADGRVIRFEEQPWGAWTETAVDWLSEQYEMKDRIHLPLELCPWDRNAYEGAVIRRINALTDGYLLDIVSVTVPERRKVSLMNHFSGMLAENGAASWQLTDDRLCALDQRWLKQKRKLMTSTRASSFHYQLEEGCLRQLFWSSQPCDIYTALTPDNPPDRDRTSIVMRADTDQRIVFVQALLYDSNHKTDLDAFDSLAVNMLADNEYRIVIATAGERQAYSLFWHESGAELAKCD